MKKIISIAMVLVIICTFIGCGTIAATDAVEPGIVGLEYIEDVVRLDTAHDNGEIEFEYEVRMVQAQGYWVVMVEGRDGDAAGYMNLGIYDHHPSEEEIDTLWEKRMPEDDLYDEINKYEEMYE